MKRIQMELVAGLVGGNPRNWIHLSVARLMCVLFWLILVETMAAAPGSLDLSFGSGGKATADVGPGSDTGSGVVVQTDGRLVVAGRSGIHPKIDFALARFTQTGELDSSFGIGGKVTTPVGVTNGLVWGVALQNDGKTLVAGRIDQYFGLARYTSTGALDPSFGNGGIVATDLGVGYNLALQNDGKILVAGHINFDFGLVRYTTSGTLDTGFGNGGKVTTDVGGADDLRAVVVQNDGKILVAGYSEGGTIGYDFALARYTSDGELDVGFGNGGKVTTDLGSGYDVAFGLALQSDHKIVVVGSVGDVGTDDDIALVRYTSTGALDTSFGSGGKVITDFSGGSESGRGVVVQGDGKIIAVGSTSSAPNSSFAVVRYHADGSLDNGFGNGGRVSTPEGSGTSVALQNDGKIVVAGSSGTNFAVVRYENDYVPLMVTTQPINTTANVGTNITFNTSIVGHGLPVAYQWYKDGYLLLAATNATLSITNIVVADVGRYWAIASTSLGSLMTAPATLTIPGAFTETGNHYLQTRGTQEYLRIDNANAFNFTNTFSIMFWFRADDDQPTNVTSTLHPMVSKWDAHSVSAYPFTIRFIDRRSSKPRRVQAQVWDTVNNPVVVTPTNLDTNYHHVAFVRKGSLLMLFYDGVLSDYGVFSIGSVANDNPIYFGRNGGLLSFRGALDDVQFWNRAVSHAEVLHLMHNDPNFSDPTLVAYYDFDSENGVDRSTGGHHATVTGTLQSAPQPVLSPSLAYGMQVGDFFPTTRYRLQRVDSLTLGGSPIWQDATNAVRAGADLFDYVGSSSNRYYRLVSP